ncbi:MAG TPA: DUF1269 domain-containing protein [Solirubrobacteraceae bacterium]|nr:DUF1269 domain-containing protein [Solirubrobacteraceae bacterium]
MSLDLAVVVFPHVDDADHVYADAVVADRDAAWLREAAIVEHHRHDRIEVRGSVAGHWVDAGDEGDAIGKKTVEGALTGVAVGLVFGPAGWAAGFALGGAAGGIAQSDSAPHVHSAFFDEVRADVPPKSSAIVLLAAADDVDQMAAAVEGKRHGRLTRRRLSDETVAALQKAVAGSPPLAPG